MGDVVQRPCVTAIFLPAVYVAKNATHVCELLILKKRGSAASVRVVPADESCICLDVLCLELLSRHGCPVHPVHRWWAVSVYTQSVGRGAKGGEWPLPKKERDASFGKIKFECAAPSRGQPRTPIPY